jgi:glucuronyl esterase-like protein
MKGLRLISIAPANLQVQTERRQERTTKIRGIAMPKFYNNFNLAKAALSLVLLLLVLVVTLGTFAQEGSSIPLVYSVENTAANYAPPAFPSFAQLPIIRPLTDPFRFADGTRDTSFTSWERRRSEIKAAIEKYEIGPKPDCSDCTITATYTPPAAGSVRGTLTVLVTRNGKSLTLTSGVYIPQGMGSGPFPALIPMTFFFFGTGANYGSLPSSVFASRPIATVDFFHNNVTAYSFSGGTNHSNDPFYQLYPELCAGTCNGNVSNSGQYAAWAWGVSRLIDGMEIATNQAVNPLPIDMKHLAVTGCSYAGKMALFAGAFDERVALTIPQESGGGGAPSWRITRGIEAYGASEDIQRTDYNWFAGQMRQFSGDNGYKLPTDHHELMAMVAPRALLETGNTDFYWLSNRSNYITARATQKVYNTLGIGDRFGFYIDGGHGHCATLPAEAPAIAAFVDKFLLGNATANTNVEVNPYPTLDYGRWTAWWGRKDPTFPNNWNPGNGSVIISMTRPIRINSDDTVFAGYTLSMPGGHPAAEVSLAGGNVQTDVTCPDGSSYTLTIPLPAQNYSIPADDDSWFPGPNQKSPLVYQGSTTASSGCNGGVARIFYLSALGVSAGTGNPPAAPGFSTTNTAYPLNVRFHFTSASEIGAGGSWSPTVTVNYKP